jgi:hypothetical protein
VIVAVFVRRLRDGVSFEDFIAAWEADKGFGVPARVFNAVSLDDPREILSIGFVDIEASAFETAMGGVAEQEAVRHSRIDEVVETTALRAFFDLRSEHDFSGTPNRIELASAQSLLGALRKPLDP